jgi:hypothetical protein
VSRVGRSCRERTHCNGGATMKPAIDCAPVPVIVRDESGTLMRAWIIAMYTENGKTVYVVAADDGPVQRGPNEGHILEENEGVTWCRGMRLDSPEANALSIVLELS